MRPFRCCVSASRNEPGEDSRGPRSRAHQVALAEEHDFVEDIQHPGRRLVDGHGHSPVPLAQFRQCLSDCESRCGVCREREQTAGGKQQQKRRKAARRNNKRHQHVQTSTRLKKKRTTAQTETLNIGRVSLAQEWEFSTSTVRPFPPSDLAQYLVDFGTYTRAENESMLCRCAHTPCCLARTRHLN